MKRLLFGFFHDDRGTGTMEFILWVLPTMTLLLCITDASVLYLVDSDLYNVAREAVREVSVGALTEDEVPAYVQARALLGNKTVTVSTYSGALVAVELSVNVGDASIIGFFKPLLPGTLDARVQMRREPTLEPPA